jgi:osmoprotectant transport system substrate-binding protein
VTSGDVHVPFAVPNICATVRARGTTLGREVPNTLVACRSTVCAGLALVALTACAPSAEDDRPPTALGDDAITVGSFDFPESVLLAEIYSQALESAGYTVDRAFGLGPREFVGPALDNGLIELVPDYAGTALAFRSLGAARASADLYATRRDLDDALAGSAVEALDSAPAQDANAFVVSRATARRYHLQRLSDLADVAGTLSFGGPPECPSRPLCLQGLRDQYGLRFAKVLALDAGGPLTHQALRDGGVDVALMFTTDPNLDDYVELVDDKGIQPAENVTPLIRRDVVDHLGQDVTALLDAVSRELDTRTLRELNATDAEEPGSDDVAAIATAWLQAQGAS